VAKIAWLLQYFTNRIHFLRSHHNAAFVLLGLKSRLQIKVSGAGAKEANNISARRSALAVDAARTNLANQLKAHLPRALPWGGIFGEPIGGRSKLK
jgi:hypothetical protein